MTLVHFKFTKPSPTGRVPATGTVRFAPSRLLVLADVDGTVVMPSEFSLTVPETGVMSVPLDPTSAGWAWTVQVFGFDGVTAFTDYLLVPDEVEKNYSALVKVNPKSLEPIALPEAAWWAEMEATKTLAGDVQAARTEAVAAAAAAEAVGDTNDAIVTGLLQTPTSQFAPAIDGSILAAISAGGAARGELNAAIDDSTKDLSVKGNLANDAALGAYRARLMTRNDSSVPLVFCGDSYVAGTVEVTTSSFPAVLAGNWPYVHGYAASKTAGPRATGLTFLNMGQSGQSSNGYIPLADLPTIAAWNPALVVHCVAANDALFGYYTPAQAKANILRNIDGLDSGAALPMSHVLIHGHQRSEALIHPWEGYLPGLYEIAAERNNVVVLNADVAFKALGVPSPNPMGILIDAAHVGIEGHALYAQMLDDVLKTSDTPPPVQIFHEDFSDKADGPLAGAKPTEGYGTWEMLSSSWNIVGGAPVAQGNLAYAVINIKEPDYDLYVELIHGTGEPSVILGGVDSSNLYYLQMGAYSALRRTENGVGKTIYAGGANYTAGQTYTVHVEVRGPKIRINNSGATASTAIHTRNPKLEETWTKVGFMANPGTAVFKSIRATMPG